MNKADLIERVARELGGRHEATTAVEVVVDTILREVSAGGTVGITGFGTFERIDRAPRTGRNPRTGDPVPIEATSAPRFRPGTYFKRVVSDPAELPAQGLAGVRCGNGVDDQGLATANSGKEETKNSRRSPVDKARKGQDAIKKRRAVHTGSQARSA